VKPIHAKMAAPTQAAAKINAPPIQFKTIIPHA
jgi:hypothetical protein